MHHPVLRQSERSNTLAQVQVPRVAVSKAVLDWLLEEDEPSARYETLVRLLGRNENEPSVRTTRSLIGTRGWAARIRNRTKEQTYWDNPNSCYVTKFSAGSSKCDL